MVIINRILRIPVLRSPGNPDHAGNPLFLLLLLTLLVSCHGRKLTKAASAHMRKPNVIFLLTDDQRWDALGAMSNTIIQTPNLDTLARRGILFRNAYVTTSICCCSRASILTGQYTSRHKINDFSTDLDSAATAATYPILLKQQGYKIGFIDKYGVGTRPPSALYDYWTCTEKSQPD